MTIEALIAVAQPPIEPVDAFNGPWEPIEAVFGTPLPQDFKDLARRYGAGTFLEILQVHMPSSPEPGMDLIWQARNIRAGLLQLGDLEEPLWPDPEGLIPFGQTDYSDFLFWRPRGPPDSWPIVIWGRGLQEFETIDCGLTDFLTGLATGEIETENLPDDLASCPIIFQPLVRGKSDD